MEKGLNDGGYLVCKFVFRVSLFESVFIPAAHDMLQRVPGQSPLQTKDEEGDNKGEIDDNQDADDGSDEDLTA